MTVIAVSQLNRYVKSLIEGDEKLQSVYIRGEISNFVNHSRSGHFYLSLKDEGALVKAVMFRGFASKLAFVPENGMRVIVRARVSLYEKDGSFQIYIEEMQPDGVGALQLAFEQLKARLEKEGLFDARRKQPIPACPTRIGVATSPTGAAVRDILHVLGRRFPLACVIFTPVLVQGEDAPPQLVEALERFDRLKRMGSPYAPQVIILGRGGGSLEELWAFNDERVARAVAACSIPVISAVGHETDFTICDFVADLRAPTPSAAAELAVPHQEELLDRIRRLERSLRQRIQYQLTLESKRLMALRAKRCLASPMYLIEERGMRLDYTVRAFTAAARLHISKSQNRLSDAAGRLDTLSPLRVLSRGYAVVYKAGRVVQSVREVEGENRLTLQFSDGKRTGRFAVEDEPDGQSR